MVEQTAIANEIVATGRRRRGPGPMFAAVCIALLLGLALGALAVWRWGDRLKTMPGPVAKVVAPAPVALSSLDLPTLTAREAALAGQLAALEARTAQVGQVAGTAGGYATRAEDLLIAQAARRRIERGLPLGYLEPEIGRRFGATQPRAVAMLRQASQNPVTLEDLRLGLDTVGGEFAYDGGGAGWLSAIERQLANLVVLHRTGTPSPAPAERIARMRRALGRGHVEEALAEATSLPGATPKNSWVVAARNYVAAEQSLDAIERAALAIPSTPAFTSATEAPPPP